ncbi:MAG: hypothetical protein AB7L90_06020 [Hyphomicrobiaceae bacterium]
MSLFKSIAIGTLVLVGAVTTAAAHDGRRIERIQTHQRAAIEAGRWDGSITKREQRRLLAEQERIDAARRHAKADGHISSREARAIRAAQRDARAHIAADSKNRQVNLWRHWKARRGI